MDKEPLVFVPNVPMKFDMAINQARPVVDINAAARFGTLVVMTKGKIEADKMPAAIKQVKNCMQNNQMGLGRTYQKVDYILAIGDIVLLSAAIIQATNEAGPVNLIRWDNSKKSYTILRLELGGAGA